MVSCFQAEKNSHQTFDEQISSANVSTVKELNQIGNVEVATMKKELITPQNESMLKEVLDNGTVLAVNGLTESEVTCIAETLGVSYEATEIADMQTLQGILIMADMYGEYQIEEVIAEIVQRTDDKTEMKPEEIQEELNAIREDEKIDVKNMYGDIISSRWNEARFEKVPTAELQAMQSSTSMSQVIQKSFADKTTDFVLYSSPSKPYTEYDPSSTASRIKLANVKVSLYALKLKTSGSYQYNSFTGKVSVAPYKVDGKDKVAVKEYHAKLSTYASSRYQTLDYTVFENSSKATPGAQNIDNHTGYQYTQWWNAKPINPSKGDSYEIVPSITTKIKDAETTVSSVKAVCSYVYLKELLTAGWETDVDKYVKIKFKNHKSAGTGDNK